jgi:hypothetical protein
MLLKLNYRGTDMKKKKKKKKALKVKTNLRSGALCGFSRPLANFVEATKDLLLWPWD